MSQQPIKSLNLPNLPEWARWCARIELSSDLKIQLASLRYTQWDMSFYPVFLNADGKALFEFPKDLTTASSDGRLWHCCPYQVFFSESSSELIFDDYDEGDHPSPPHATRYLVSPQDYICKTIESKTGNYEQGGGAIPRLSEIPADFVPRVLQLFPAASHIVLSKPPAAPSWPLDKRKR